MLATLLSVLTGTLALCVWFLTSDTTAAIFLLLVPLGLVTFGLSLLIGHFLAEPLNLLEQQVKAFNAGGDVTFTSDGRLYEADELASTISALVKKSASQQQDLVLRERQQAAFVSDVAHELRTPLTAIRGNADLLRDPDLPPELHDKFCTIVVSESERLTRLVNDLLTYGEVQPEPTFGVTVNQLGTWLEEDLRGIQVIDVTAGSAADLAGIRTGDFILSAAGTPVNSSQDLLRVRRGLYVGDQVTMEIWRDGQRLEVTLELNDAAS